MPDADAPSQAKRKPNFSPYLPLPAPPTLEANSPPAAPASVTLTRSDGTVTASWPEVSGAASYHVTYSSDGENSWTAAPCGNNCTVGNNGVAVNGGVVSITISGVNNAKTYVVGVRASDNGGQWSGWTNSAAIAPQLPAAPSSVTLSRAAGQLTVTWTAVSAATSYNVNISGDGTNSWTRAVSGATGTGNTITKTIDSGIDNWRWYIAGVQAVNDKGAGGWTNSDFVAPIYSPGPVGNLSAERSGAGISVTWNAPDNNGGSAVTGYDVNYTVDGGHSWTRVHTGLGASTTSATISNVSNAVDYVVAVRANNGVGEGGAWTNSAPVAGLAGPATVSAVKSGDYIDGAWSAVAGATGYDVNLLYFQNEYHYRIETNMTGTSRRIYINDGSDFSPEQFVIAVRARNAHGPGAWVNSPPATPAPTLTATSLTATTATLAIGNHNAAWWYKRTSPTGDATCHSVAAGTASDALSGLTSGTSYTYKAYDKSGCASADEIASVTFTQVTPPGSRDSSKDFNTLSAAGNTSPDGIWSDGTTMWVSDATDVKVYAYNLATKARDDSKDVSLSGTVIPVTLGSDGTTMWVADVITTSKLFAYSISGKSRDASKDITLHTDNANTFGLWSNGTTIWVGDGTDDYIYAYTISTGARDTGKEIDLHSDNDKVGGLWSDGVTMWVSDHSDDKLYAYKMSDGSRIAAKDYNNLDSQSDLVYGIWSDGTTMWVADNTTDKLYAYHTIAP